MRKIIQIQALNGSLYALCDDGSLWLQDSHSEWCSLPGIPQDTAENTDKPAQAGKRWLTEDDEQLASLWCQQRLDARSIAEQMQRSEGAIIARLVHLDFYTERDDARAESQRRLTEQGARNAPGLTQNANL